MLRLAISAAPFGRGCNSRTFPWLSQASSSGAGQEQGPSLSRGAGGGAAQRAAARRSTATPRVRSVQPAPTGRDEVATPETPASSASERRHGPVTAQPASIGSSGARAAAAAPATALSSSRARSSASGRSGSSSAKSTSPATRQLTPQQVVQQQQSRSTSPTDSGSTLAAASNAASSTGARNPSAQASMPGQAAARTTPLTPSLSTPARASAVRTRAAAAATTPGAPAQRRVSTLRVAPLEPRQPLSGRIADAVDAYISSLNAEQLAAATHTGRVLRIKAGPGSGKTRVVTARVAWLLQQQLASPSNILVITFTNKAANELKERLEGVLGERTRKVTAGTFHSICGRILRLHVGLLNCGLDRNFVVADTDDSEATVKRVLENLPMYASMDGTSLNKVASTLREVFSILKNKLPTTHGVSVAGLIAQLLAANQLPLPLATPGVRPELMKNPAHLEMLFAAYHTRLRNANLVDFDDLLGLTVAVLQSQQTVRTQLRARFQHILVDEFQDTNQPQYELVKLLALPGGPQATEPDPHLFTVGDPDQSIYGWRGANSRNMDTAFERDFPGCATAFLACNYRSGEKILRVAEAVLGHGGGLPSLHKRLQAMRQHGGHVEHVIVAHEKHEAKMVAQKCQYINGNMGQGYGTMAVLYRTNNQMKQMEEELSRRGIPYRVVGEISLWKRKEAKDVMSYLKLVANLRDEPCLTRIMNKPTRGLGGDKTEDKLRELAASKAPPINVPQLVLGDCEDVWLGRAATQAVFERVMRDTRDEPILAELGLAADVSTVLGPKAVPAAAAKGLNELRNLVVLMRNVARYLPLPDVMRVLEEGGKYRQYCNKTASYDHAYVKQLRNYIGRPESWLAGHEDGLSEMEVALEAPPPQNVIRLNGSTQVRPGFTSGAVVTLMDNDGVPITNTSAASAATTPVVSVAPPSAPPAYTVVGGGDDGPGLGALRAFLEHATLVRELEENEEEAALDRVTLMTLHAAKGLEYSTVFFIGFEEGLVPMERGAGAQPDPTRLPTDYAEEKRLAYVGCTRAKDRLFLITAKARTLFLGAFSKRKPATESRYLPAIRKECRDLIKVTDRSDLDGEQLDGEGRGWRGSSYRQYD